ncbi:MAG: restriction endonuclease [Bacteroidetes bacterium]|nr:restriction endonuclease [Bacteroidota bacterium]MCA6442132.1 restriction endonuclease [Bacteroidota bacterium]
MNLWMVRAGKHGEKEEICIDKGLVIISWNELPNLKTLKTKESLKEEYQKHYSEKSIYSLGSKVGQIWRFANDIKKGDLIVLPSKFTPAIHLGIAVGEYEFKEIEREFSHIIKVKWEKTISRTEFEEDLLYSFGSLLTVSNISRNNAYERVTKILKGAYKKSTNDKNDWQEYEKDDPIKNINTDDLIYTRIEKFIQNNFKDYDFEDLIREILKAHGLNTSSIREIGNIKNSKKKGSDGGVDILASKGLLGFEEPKICVQVKSGSSQQPPAILRELYGVMTSFNSTSGLLVSWGGFSPALIKESREKYFSIRLWNSDNILKEIFDNYDKFSQEFKARLPLKRIWILEEVN